MLPERKERPNAGHHKVMNPRVKSQAVLAMFRYARRENQARQKGIQSKEFRKVEIREFVTTRGRDYVPVSILNTIPLSNSSLPEMHPYYFFFFDRVLQ